MSHLTWFRHIRDLQLSLSAPFGEGVQNFIIAIGSLVVAFYFAWNLTLVIICTLPVIYIIQALVSKRLSARSHEQSEMLQEVLKYVANAIENIDTVKYFTGEEHELRLFTKAATAAANMYNRVANFRSIQIGIMQFFTISIFFQAFWYGSHLVHSKNKDVGDVMTTFWGAIMAIQGVTGFLPQFIVMQRGRIAGAQLQNMLTEGASIDEPEKADGKLASMRCKGDVSFREVGLFNPLHVRDYFNRSRSRIQQDKIRLH
jgi:ATP-binding cassette, subfamily B (MDR/TAP), member 1